MSEQERRLEAIVLLLRTLHDYDFQPLCWTSALVQRQAKRGEGPTERMPCPDCVEGAYRVRGILHGCPTCGGSGQPLTQTLGLRPRLVGRGRGWIKVDGYTQKHIGSSDTDVVVDRRTVLCDSCGGKEFGNGRPCERCGNSGRVTITHAVMRPFRGIEVDITLSDPGPGDPRIRAMEKRAEAGSYDELLKALEALHGAWPTLYRRVWEAYVLEATLYGDPALEGLCLGWALDFLSARMPEQIIVPAAARSYDRRRRQKRPVAA